MAASNYTSFLEVRAGGSDTLNDGVFEPNTSMNSNLAATSANTSSPVVTSATYNFVAGDVGAWVFIAGGTNWIPGWYQIASVAANAATLTAGIGTAILYKNGGALAGLNTVAGCATTASPTSGSWTVDYSQQDSAQYALTGLTTAGADAIILTASASVNMLGNGLVIKAGTNFTTGNYLITAVSAGVSITVDRTCTSAAGAAGTAGIGGAFASPGKAGAVAVNGSAVAVKYNASPFLATTASTNVAGGCVTNSACFFGYDTSRFLFNTDANRPTFKIDTGVSTAILFINGVVQNFILDGNSQTTSKGGSNLSVAWRVKFQNFTAVPCNTAFLGWASYVEVTACSGASVVGVQGAYNLEWSYIHDNTFTGAATNSQFVNNCIFDTNSGAGPSSFVGCTNVACYNNTGNNFSGGAASLCTNCISENSSGYGYAFPSSSYSGLINCSSYNNTSGRLSPGFGTSDQSPATFSTSASVFTNAGSGDFSLNNTAGAGAVLRATEFPDLFPGGLTANYGDVGPAQHQDSGGGGPIGHFVKVNCVGSY